MSSIRASEYRRIYLSTVQKRPRNLSAPNAAYSICNSQLCVFEGPAVSALLQSTVAGFTVGLSRRKRPLTPSQSSVTPGIRVALGKFRIRAVGSVRQRRRYTLPGAHPGGRYDWRPVSYVSLFTLLFVTVFRCPTTSESSIQTIPETTSTQSTSKETHSSNRIR